MCEAHSKYDIDIIIPCDAPASLCLDILWNRTSGHSRFDVVKKTLSNWQAGFNSAARTRSTGIEMVRSIGLRTPRQVTLLPDVTTAAFAELGSPIVVKQDHRDGGTGVFIASTAQDALDAASILARGTQTGEGGRIVAQEFIAGRSASVSFSARQGHVLEAFAYIAIHQHPMPAGAASLISVIESPELLETTRRIVSEFGYSGFGGVDFILPSDGSPSAFLELNARPTQTAHLGSLFGADLCRAMACSLKGESYASAFNPAGLPPIALFPNELMRDPASPHLLKSYHDFPWYERRIAPVALDRALALVRASQGFPE